MMRSTLLQYLVASLSISCWLCAPARSDTTQQAKAKAHVNVGASLYRAERYKEALHEFEVAFQLMPRPLVLINMGQCYRKLDDPRGALEAYERYLAVVGKDDPQRPDVEALAETMRQQIAAAPTRPHVDEPPAPTPHIVASPPPPVFVAAPDNGRARRQRLALGLGVAGGVIAIGAVTLGLLFGLPAGPPSAGLGNYQVLR